MDLKKAYQAVIEDVLLNGHLEFDVEITKALAKKIAKYITEIDDVLINLEESVATVLEGQVDEIAEEFDLYDNW